MSSLDSQSVASMPASPVSVKVSGRRAGDLLGLNGLQMAAAGAIGLAAVLTVVGAIGSAAGPAWLWLLVGGLLIAAAGCWGVHLLKTRTWLSGLTDELRRRLDGGQLTAPLPPAGHRLDPLVDLLNEFLAALQDQAGEIAARRREMAVQMRVAAADKKHTEEIIHSISDAVIVTDAFDEVVLANPAAEALFGFEFDPETRRPIQRLVDDETLVEQIRQARAAHRAHGRRQIEHAIERDGERRDYTVTLSTVSDERDKTHGVVAVLRDDTQQKEIARAKTDFVSHVSHELRTPLSSIRAYVEMLVDGDVADAAARQEAYKIIEAEADRLGRLIDNILNISRIESGVVRINKEPLSLELVVKDALDVLGPQAATRGIRLVSQIAPATHQVEADREQISQAVMNLIGNALKYTLEGGEVRVETRVDEGAGTLQMIVADTGVGIGPEDLPHVFDKFYRVRDNNKVAKGTGLGLALVKHIVETVHGGRMSVESTKGVGSTFTMTLPLIA